MMTTSMRCFMTAATCLVLVAFRPPSLAARDDPAGHGHGGSTSLYAIPEQSPGHAQSPINILSAATDEGHHELRFGDDRHPHVKTVAYNGHAVRIDFSEADSLTFDGTAYALEQCHFHTPSEHRIDGITWPMEMHCVAEGPPVAGGEDPSYLVLAWLFRMGESNGTVAALIGGHPARGETRAAGDEKALDAAIILDGLGIAGHFYSYQGSLTTPPYSESVRWVIDKEIRQASPEEIAAINAIEGDNARHIQPVSGRRIESE